MSLPVIFALYKKSWGVEPGNEASYCLKPLNCGYRIFATRAGIR